MKYILSILLASAFFTCGDDPTQTYTLTNETKFSLEIKGFSHRGTENNRFVISAEVIKLEALESISFERRLGRDFDPRTWFSEDDINSVRIFFNNKKLLILECGIDISNTDLCHSIFQPNITASITQEDYDNTKLIE